MPTDDTSNVMYTIDPLSSAERTVAIHAVLDMQSLLQMRLTEANQAGDQRSADAASTDLEVVSTLLGKIMKFPVD